jgi:cytochrome c oxidase subunit 3/cytochrome o ubiquinol oxidase subunit 3
MSTIPLSTEIDEQPWVLPDRGISAMICLIIAEASIFIIFVIAYIFYAGKSLSGPKPADVLELPIFSSICLLSSSITAHFAVSALRKSAVRSCGVWLLGTFVLGGIFIGSTANEWYHLIYEKGLTLQTNLFGTTFYSLVGLHASHVIVGLCMLTIALIAALRGKMNEHHAEKLEVLSLYWHFVDAVWIIVFVVVYVLGR